MFHIRVLLFHHVGRNNNTQAVKFAECARPKLEDYARPIPQPATTITLTPRIGSASTYRPPARLGRPSRRSVQRSDTAGRYRAPAAYTAHRRDADPLPGRNR